MSQHPKVAAAWAVAALEQAIADLGDSHADGRVRRQFHQLLLALERDGYVFQEAAAFQPPRRSARILPMTPRVAAGR